MTKLFLKSLVGATALSMAVIGTASAGGFSRGNADTGILYEPGNFNMRSSVTLVSPSRKITAAVGNPNLVGTQYANDYVMPSVAVKMGITENFSCAGTLNNAYGGSASYAQPKNLALPGTTPLGLLNYGKKDEDFSIYETALTCGVKFQLGKGNLHVIGGGFMEKFNYDRVDFLGPNAAVGSTGAITANLRLSGEDYGWRAGIAYEIPEIAFRTELLYRSGTSYGADGSLVIRNNLAGTTLADLPAIGEGELPQSFTLNFQSGVAPGWLVLGSVKWTDWSVTKQLVATAFAAPGVPVIRDANNYFWKDGWTVTAGVGHAFNEQVSGLMALTWDSGVATGWDGSSDTWTLSAGGSVKDSWGGELRAGAGLTYITSATETQGDKPMSYDSGWAVAGNVGYAIKW